MNRPIIPAKISYNPRGTLISELYSDQYYSNQGALEEIEHNFLNANNLKQRFSQLQDNQTFTIAETGFGTGLNFLKTWQLFNLANTAKCSTLHFFSAEKHPLTKKDLINAIAPFNELKPLYDQLIAQYPKLLPGFHTLYFGNVTLTLIFSDATIGFSQAHSSIDAWFLDGFMPTNNEKMWDTQLFDQVSRLSHLETTLSTFSCARVVKDGLLGAGFKIKTKKGFAKKREMLTATFIGKCGPLRPKSNQFYSLDPIKKRFKTKKIAIIGAGFSGCATAYALNKKNHSVTIFDQQAKIAQGASSNPKAAIYLKPGSKNSYNNRFYLSAFFHSLRQTQLDSLPIETCGMIQLIHNEKELKKQQELVECGLYFDDIFQVKNNSELSEISGINIDKNGLFYPLGAMATPKSLCKYWSQHAEFVGNTQITSIDQNTDNTWRLTSNNNEIFEFDQVVICNAFSAIQFKQTKHLPLKKIRGQVTSAPTGRLSKDLKTIICGEHYITPAENGVHCFGATFDLKDDDSQVRDSDNIKNIQNIETMIPSIQGEFDPTKSIGNTGFRCTTPDYMPIVGPCVPAKQYSLQFQHIQNPQLRSIKAAPIYEGLYINVGFGSKGASTASMCADIISRLIDHQSLPLEIDLLDHLHPGRFLIRDISRKKSQFI
ncbi:bifunctional tRNA (5-methylaminomethyl-2-thiouridine)(34)-methyltransferase MnmD/FAD-dependent 5-carboxymethylaminomethyl-2-thiouridine(34) oxidoreductase MnmC [Marinicellulosiphila megalodicopiae]|uniref:bifunctional tRNA (5-methylaminomethyl-2-thiouridine)(34)-methyltransferase MnmD/FAD-dependent 5-carboxymethylaminomethyl-2-thiouridine(34) oxidoreductase MnmC n=1 Tax=Marinicellulosiphila megalodicopiae TaxID=2724896 RepID=UPI003BAF5081